MKEIPVKRHTQSAFAILLLALILPASAMAERLPGSDHGGAPLVASMTSTPTGPSGIARITVNPGQQEVCYDITTVGVTVGIIAAHIHAAATGAIAVGLFGPPSLPSPTGPFASSFGGCVFADRATALDILMNPTDYFVNLHTIGLASVMKGTLTGP
jgi:CHRD domain